MDDNSSSFIHRNDFSTYQHNSFHIYDQFINTNNIYNAVHTLPLQESSKESINQSNDYKMNWVPSTGRRRRQRTVFTQSNIQQLDSVFVYNQYPDIELRDTLAAQLDVSESRIQVWFKNRRTRARTTQRQQLKILES